MSACLHRAILLTITMLALLGCSEEDAPPKATAPAPVSAAVPAAVPATATAPSEQVFNTEQLDQMLAPLALYPDALLAQVLMATTYPGNVADAVAWSKAHPNVSGDAAVQQVAEQPWDWDPSVQSLVAFPQVLATLGQDPVWVQRVGDAFLAQPDAVMNSVQRLRAKAKAAGHLESNDKQSVIVQPSNAQAGATTAGQGAASAQTIIIQPTNPQVVYVPSYNPSVVYGNWSSASYPPAYYPPPPGYAIGTALATGLAFGAGVAIVNSLWGDCDWDDHDVDINVNRYNNINNINRRLEANQNSWRHNPTYRDGVPYRDQASRAQFDRRLPGSTERTAYRGDTPARLEDRARARESLAQRGIEAPATSNLEARQRAQSAERERAQQSLEKHGINQPASARERAQVADRQHKPGAQAPLKTRQHQPSERNQQARQQVRQQHARAQAPRNNALADVRNPSRARMASNRGQISQRSASRPSAAPAGHQLQRPVRMQSSAGGRRR